MKFFLSFVIVLSLTVTQVVSAQVDTGSFLIRVFGGVDVQAPTTPTLQSATPVATSQIDLTWTPSTDNFVVSGYVLYRDIVPIATTTLTTFSDTSLSASTTYSYFVRAFDPSFNYSSSSNTLTATTLSVPVVPPAAEEGTTQSTAARVVLNELVVTPGILTTSFFVQTARPARFELRWGKTSSYELGYVVSERFVDTYWTTITDLEPMTTYEYQVVGYSQLGQTFILKKGTFTTLGTSGLYAPANAARFVARNQNNQDVALSWDAPSTPYQYVRLVRSNLGFPTHPQDGAVVYQGRGTQYIDGGVLSQFSPAYYTLFVIDAAGNSSSGAVAVVYALDAKGVAMPTETSPESVEVGEPTEDAVASTSPALPQGTIMPELSQIYIIQGSAKLSLAERLIPVASDQPFIVSIPKDAVFENLKTIIVTITDPTDSRKQYAFLLRLNKDKTAYEGVFDALGVAGTALLRVDIYDFKVGVVGTYKKNLSFAETTFEVTPLFPDLLVQRGLPLLIAIFFFLIVPGLLYVLFKKKRTPEDNQ